MTATPLLAYGAALVDILVLDGVWLGLLAKDLYKREMGPLMRDKLNPVPGIVFYLLYPAAVVFLCTGPGASSLGDAGVRGAVLGAAAYGAYDLTNLAVVRGWPVRLSFIDWAWGTVLTAVAAVAALAARAW